MKLSIIIPVFNEESNIDILYCELCEILSVENCTYELLYVDDGSSDCSLERIKAVQDRDDRAKLISFSRNFGHMAALSAGLDYSCGDAVITMDADMQHPPEMIPEMLEKWRNGADVVNMIRKSSVGKGLFAKLCSSLFYALFRRMTGFHMPANFADFRLLDRKVVDALKGMKERSKFLRGMISWVGFNQVSIYYEPKARYAGETKYSFSSMILFAMDGITAFSTVPLRLAVHTGFIMAFVSLLYLLYAVLAKLFTTVTLPGWTSVIGAVLLIGGVQLVFLGVIGEYLGRVFEETKHRPVYIVKEKSGFDDGGTE